MSKTIMVSDSAYAKIKASAERNFRSLIGELDYILARLDSLEKEARSAATASDAGYMTPEQEDIVDKMYKEEMKSRSIMDEIKARPDIAQLKQEIDDTSVQLENTKDGKEARVLIERIRDLEVKRNGLINEARAEAGLV